MKFSTMNVPLFVRISATEYAENGWNVEDSVALSKILKEKGVDLIDVSSGGNISGAKINVFSGYQVPFSCQIKTRAEAKNWCSWLNYQCNLSGRNFAKR